MIKTKILTKIHDDYINKQELSEGIPAHRKRLIRKLKHCANTDADADAEGTQKPTDADTNH